MTDPRESSPRAARNMRRKADAAEPTPESADTRSGLERAADRLVEAAPTRSPEPAVAPAPRAPTDFDGLDAVAQLDKDVVARMLAEFAPPAKSFRATPGQRVNAVVTRVNASTVFVDLGGKADAVLDRMEAPADVTVGQRIVAWVHSYRDGEVRLTMTPSGEAANEMLREAAVSRTPVSGTITAANDHGVIVTLGDGVRAFCPLSQLDRGPVDPASLVGLAGKFRVLEVKERDVLVSRRSVLEEEAREEDLGRMRGLREGDVVEGTVTSLREFGAFVRLQGGIEGLVHISNMSRQRVNDPAEVVKEGQTVKVKVLSVDLDRRRVNLGMKQAEDAPLQDRSNAGGRGFNMFAGLLGDVKVKR